MSRLPRPSIPVWVELTVARRQLGWSDMGLEDITKRKRGLGALLRFALDALKCKLDSEKIDLHHEPPLGAREKVWKDGEIVGYVPDANDPEHLLYIVHVDHKVRTNIRGEHGQHPDRVLIKKQRRLERGPRPKRKTRWATGRNLRGPGFPPKGSRKIQNRRKPTA